MYMYNKYNDGDLENDFVLNPGGEHLIRLLESHCFPE